MIFFHFFCMQRRKRPLTCEKETCRAGHSAANLLSYANFVSFGSPLKMELLRGIYEGFEQGRFTCRKHALHEHTSTAGPVFVSRG